MKLFRTKGGFSFVELLLVVIIIGIITAVAVPRLKSTYEKFEFENFCKNIYYLIEYLQNSSIVEKKVYYLYINKDKAEFTAKRLEDGEAVTWKGRFAGALKVPGKIKLSLEPETDYIGFFPNGKVDGLLITFTDSSGRKITIDTKSTNNDIQIR